jgi:3-oxoacyl-[acyl-carrier-protein] synthase-3
VKAGIVGVGGALPEGVVTNAHFAARLDTTDAWIVKRTGIRERRWLNGQRTLADLAVEASAMALEDAGLDGPELDRVVVATITADRVTPGLAPELAARVGATGAAAEDVNAACAGFLYALDHAAALVESGRARVVLVCAAEAISRITDAGDRSTAVLFGDGAGAVVVAGDEGLERGLGPLELHSDHHPELLYADRRERVLRMDGREVYLHAVARMVEATAAALQRAGVSPDDLDLFVAHQANARIVRAAAEQLGVPPDRVVLDVEKVANTSAASIPLALFRAERDGRLRPGATVALTAFGAGFVWGAAIVPWKEPARTTTIARSHEEGHVRTAQR